MTRGPVVTCDADTRCAQRWFVGVTTAPDVAGSPGRAVGPAGCRRLAADGAFRRQVRDGAR